jgi:hypothetical protein
VLPPDATPAAAAPGCLLKEEGGDEGVPEARLRGAPEVLASACSKTVVPNTTGGSGCPAPHSVFCNLMNASMSCNLTE